MAQIKSWSNVVALEWEMGLLEHYPAHVRVGCKYAWKPLIVQEALK